MTSVEYTGAFAVYLALAAALYRAVRLSCLRPDHRPVVLFLTYALVSDLAQLLVNTKLAPAGSGPFTGLQRVAFHVGSLLFVSDRLAVVALAAACLVGLPARFALRRMGCALLMLAVALIGLYPGLRKGSLFELYFGVHGLCVLLGASMVLRWRRTRRRRSPASSVAVVLVVFEGLTLVVGPYPWGIPGHWWLAQFVYTVSFAVIAILQRAGTR